MTAGSSSHLNKALATGNKSVGKCELGPLLRDPCFGFSAGPMLICAWQLPFCWPERRPLSRHAAFMNCRVEAGKLFVAPYGLLNGALTRQSANALPLLHPQPLHTPPRPVNSHPHLPLALTHLLTPPTPGPATCWCSSTLSAALVALATPGSHMSCLSSSKLGSGSRSLRRQSRCGV